KVPRYAKPVFIGVLNLGSSRKRFSKKVSAVMFFLFPSMTADTFFVKLNLEEPKMAVGRSRKSGVDIYAKRWLKNAIK
ncbi:MAG: hypothetical protein IJV19_00500, partial [Prevotella sp.]|nr:hypothetical protein [Prevotella sp.]